MITLPIALITAFISSGGLILGSVVGGIISWVMSRYTTKKSISQQILLQKESLQYQEKNKTMEKYINANIVRLDISTAIYQCIRSLQSNEKLVYLYSMPIYKDYHKVVASLCDKYSLRQLSNIYQIYGLLEKINKDIYLLNERDVESMIHIRNKLWDLMKMVYGENYTKVLNKNIDDISYTELYNDPLMKVDYRNLLKSLDYICSKI